MSDLGKLLIVAGLALAAIGALLWLGGGKWFWLGRLPGDFRVDRANLKFSFPLTTCLLLSVVVTVLLWLLRRR